LSSKNFTSQCFLFAAIVHAVTNESAPTATSSARTIPKMKLAIVLSFIAAAAAVAMPAPTNDKVIRATMSPEQVDPQIRDILAERQ
jgi:hypothetical protein